MEITCGICLNDLYQDMTTHLSCSHQFCSKCIGKWLEYKNTCPNCRANIKHKNINLFIKDDDEIDTKKTINIISLALLAFVFIIIDYSGIMQ